MIRSCFCALTLTFLASCAMYSSPDRTFSFVLEKDSQVSLAVYDSEGRMVRELTRAEPMASGKHTVTWDGLDQDGHPLPAGEYTWKLLSSQGLETEYVMSLGTSTGHQHWPGVHGGPSAVTVQGDHMFMAAAGSEAAMGIASAKLAGDFVWSEHSLSGWGGALDAAVAFDRVWYQYGGSTLAASLDSGENLKEAVTHLLPFKVIDLGSEITAYTEERGYGWVSTEGITAFGGADAETGLDTTGHRVNQSAGEVAQFRIDYPKGSSYIHKPDLVVHFYFGNEDDTLPESTSFISIKEGAVWKAMFDPSKYPKGQKVTVNLEERQDGQLNFTFYASRADTDKPLDLSLRRIEILAHVNRMDAVGEQMVVAPAYGSKILWIDPLPTPQTQLPSYAELTLPEVRLHAWPHDGGFGGLQSSVPGSLTDISCFAFEIGGHMDFDLKFDDGQPHQLALYFDHERLNHARSMRVTLLDPETDEVLDLREISNFENGAYLVWNIQRKHVKVRIGSTAIGGPILNALFLDPAPALSAGTSVEFVKTDHSTHGFWKNKYGKDGFWIPGDPSSVLDSADVDDIRDVEIRPDGSLVAISGNSLVTLSRENKTPVEQVSGLEDPAILAVDQNSGDILVYLQGTAQQIVRYDKNFKKLNTYGRQGGRRQGRYIASDFAGVSDIASDNRGGFLVAEWLSAPRRVAYFNREGELQHEWYGGQMFYYSPGIDPEDPSRVWLNSQFGWLFEMEVDYDKKEWKVVSTWNMKEQLDPVLFQAPTGFWIWTQPLKINGEQYLAYEQANGLILKPDYENGRLVPVAAASVARAFNMGGEAQLAEVDDDHPWKIAMQQHWASRSNHYDKRLLRQFGYVDRNGDLEMQPDEFLLSENQTQHRSDYGYGSFIGPNLTAWRWGYDNGSPLWFKIPTRDTLENGLPVWSYADKEVGPKLEDVRAMNLIPVEDGTVYLAEVWEGDGFGRWWNQTTWDGHGFGWPGTMINESYLTHRNADGELLWKAGGHHSGFPGPKGRVDLPWRLAGKVDDVLGLTSQTRQPCEFFSTDGLYIGGVLDRIADDGLPPRVYAWWRVDPQGGDSPDNVGTLRYDLGQSGKIARGPDGGVLFYGSGRNNVPVYRINGFDDIGHQTGTVEIKHPARGAAETGTGLKAQYYANMALEGEPAVERIDGDIWFGFAHKVGKEQNQQIPWPETEVTADPFSVRWTGMLEPRFTEDTVIGFYDRDAGVRVWINDELVIDAWEDNAKKEHSDPIPMIAGKPVALRIEWKQAEKAKKPEAHLVWESLSQPIAHIESRFLYPESNMQDK